MSGSSIRRKPSPNRRIAALAVVAVLALIALVVAPNAGVLLAAYGVLLTLLATVGVVFLRARD